MKKFLSTITLLLILLTTMSAQTPPPPGSVKKVGTDFCLAVYDNSLEDGANVMIDSCSAQLPLFGPIPSENNYFYIARENGLCLQAFYASQDDEGEVIQSKCFNQPEFKWIAKPAGSGFKLINLDSGECMHTSAEDNEENVILWSCLDPKISLWQF